MILTDLLQDQNPWWRDGAIRRAGEYAVRRDLQQEVFSRITQEDRRAVVLLGPRQVGKTVLLLQLADDLLDAGWPPQNLTYFDFSDDRLTERVSARDVIEVQPFSVDRDYPRVFLLDEIRLALQWDRWLKQAVDQRQGRIVATDSAASLLREGGRESGQGRWDELVMEGLSLREFVRLYPTAAGSAEGAPPWLPTLLDRYLALGGFPEHALSNDLLEARRRLRSDIAERAILRDLAGFGVDLQRVKDLLVYLVQESGAELKVEARAADLKADPRSVREWVRLLMNTLLIVPLERYARHAAASLRSRSRIFAADPGLVGAFALLPPQEPTVRAKIFETAIFRHLRDAARELEGRLFYFRKDDDLEIDFVLAWEGELAGIEATSSWQIRADKIDRLRKAGKELGTGRLLLVHGGVVESLSEGVRAVPLSRFLLNPVGYFKEEP